MIITDKISIWLNIDWICSSFIEQLPKPWDELNKRSFFWKIAISFGCADETICDPFQMNSEVNTRNSLSKPPHRDGRTFMKRIRRVICEFEERVEEVGWQ